MKTCVAILLAFLLPAHVVHGQTAQPTLAFVESQVSPGENILVTTNDGTRISGRLRSLTAESLAIETHDGPRTLRADQVGRVVVKDSIRNGLFIGMGAGAAAGLAGGLLVNAICVNETGSCPGAVLLLTGIGAAAGAGMGAGFDGLRHRTVLDLVPATPGEFSPEIGGNIGIAQSKASAAGLMGAPSIGGGWVMRHTSGFALALDASRTVGRSTHTVSCANASGRRASAGSCLGEGEEGVVDTTTATAKAQYYFMRSRVQPYVSGGAALYQDSLLIVNTVQPVPSRPPFALESLGRHRGIAIVAGGGARVGVGRRVSVRPDVTVYKSPRWTHVRASVGIGVGW